MAEISTNKRRRKEGLHLSVLPDNAVAHVATYLSNVSRALFAISSPSAMKSTILSSNAKLWETLDFGDIDYSLAEKLTDEDIHDILTIGGVRVAVNNIKCLKLTGCVNINGSGLSPLSDSVVLKQIDLGLVSQHNSPELYPEPSISEDEVIPILTSIINTEGNSMTHLQLPRKWRNSRSTQLTNFLGTYSNHLASRQCKCKACDTSIGITSAHVIISTDGHCGLQNFICYKCLNSFCDNCEEEGGRGHWLNFCHNCEKDYCIDCMSSGFCGDCGEICCSGCKLETCYSCSRGICESCAMDNSSCPCILEAYCASCVPETHPCKWEGCLVRFCTYCEKEHLLSHSHFNTY